MQFAESSWVDGWWTVPYQVPWRDVDTAGHVNNAIYFSWFEWARTNYWLTLRDRADWKGIDFVVARAECNFRKQVAIMEKVELRTRINRVGNSSLEFANEVRRHGSGELVADGVVVVVMYSWDENCKLPVDDALRARIREFQKE